MSSLWVQLAAVMVMAACSATAAWFWHLRLKNAGVIDVVWGVNLGLAALLCAALGQGWWLRKWALAAAVLATGFRLSFYLYRRVLGHEEEGRYTALRQAWATHTDLKFLAFFLFQAVLVTVLAVPFVLACLNPQPAWNGLEILAAALFCVGLAGEAMADAQLKAFKAEPTNKGRTCRQGLWRYSRHPNYFFEWVLWLSYWAYACASPWGWASFYAPLLMLHFLLNVTGVKVTEEQCLRSRGEDYARYQRETSMFIPWFPRKA